MAVCNVCGNLAANNPSPSGPQTPRSESLREWRNSAAAGCPFCAVVIDGLNKAEERSWCKEVLPLPADAKLSFQSRPLKVEVYPLDNSSNVRGYYWFVKAGMASYGRRGFAAASNGMQVASLHSNP